MKSILLLITLLFSIGTGQTKQDSVLRFVPQGEFWKVDSTARMRMHGVPTFSRDFWLAFAAKWREYEAECRKDSVLHEWWAPHIEGEIAYGNFYHSQWRPRQDPAYLPGFIRWLERNKQ